VQRSVDGGAPTRFVVDTNFAHAQVVQTVAPDGATAAFVHGADLISQSRGAATHYYQYDGQLSTRLLTDAAGAEAATYDYDAFGKPIGETGAVANDYRYAGELTDANTGFVYLRARWYQPETGRFTTVDPRDGLAFDPQSFHRYTYAHANPVMNRDPSGEFTLAGVSISISIGASLRSAYTGNLLKTFFKVNTIAQCELRLGARVRELGFEMLSAGLGSGADVAYTGQQIMANAFKAIAAAIVDFYRSLANDLTELKIGVGTETHQMGVNVNGSGEVHWTAWGVKFNEWADHLGAMYAAGEQLLNDPGNHCAQAQLMEHGVDRLVEFMPSF
jgi:RHS repeat-associated protein